MMLPNQLQDEIADAEAVAHSIALALVQSEHELENAKDVSTIL